ncbi:hypothetical protein RvY_08040-2 [Ramazzottius varieornatus]|uniref:Uncharacterized protein n=1 Tax=Ramazzottius varieornatus TaxID=947166 RepID=A0A1D1V4C1_RAMVA|nr:hypothetical protein RvY_08040-2 [Ramazzottius varieornatus]
MSALFATTTVGIFGLGSSSSGPGSGPRLIWRISSRIPFISSKEASLSTLKTRIKASLFRMANSRIAGNSKYPEVSRISRTRP